MGLFQSPSPVNFLAVACDLACFSLIYASLRWQVALNFYTHVSSGVLLPYPLFPLITCGLLVPLLSSRSCQVLPKYLPLPCLATQSLKNFLHEIEWFLPRVIYSDATW